LILFTSPATTSSVEPDRISARSPFGGGATFWILIFAALAPTWPATPTSNMQLVTSVYAPSSVSIQHKPVALLKNTPSGLEKSWSAVSEERLTFAASASDCAPNR